MIGELTSRRARRDGPRPALLCGGVRVDFAELEVRARAAAAALADLGVGKGDRVAAMMRNGIDLVCLYHGAAKAGAVLCPLNWRLAAPEIDRILHHADPGLLVFDPEFAATAAALPRPCATVAAPDFVHRGGDAASAPASVAADDPLLLVYTSGTAGRPKGAVLSHRQMWWTALTMAATLDYGRRDTDLIAAPLFHVGGLSFATLSVYLGACSAIMPAWDAGEVLRLIAEARIDHFFAVAAMVETLVAHPGFAATDLSSLRWIMAGGAPVPAALVEAFAARDIPLLQTYGATETGGPATVVDIDHGRTKAGSAGVAFFHTDVRVAGGAGEALGADEVGEIQVRGPHVAGYWRDPAATAAARHGDWFRSGDLGYQDADGYLYVLGRGSELIVSGGENVHPAEVEAVLADLPGVEEMAVVGLPDARWGETVCAVVVPAAGREISLAAVRAHCKGRIAGYKTPRRLVVETRPLPRGATGKVRRGELRARLAPTGAGSVQHQ